MTVPLLAAFPFAVVHVRAKAFKYPTRYRAEMHNAPQHGQDTNINDDVPAGSGAE